MLAPQGETESPFQYADRLVEEHKRIKLIVQAVRGGSFKGRKPNGDWWVVFKGSGEAEEIQDASPVVLISKVAVLRCYGCGCPTSIHAQRELAEDDMKGKHNKDKKRCGGERRDGTPCPCSKSPDEIRAVQTQSEWISKRLAARMMEREIPGWRGVAASTLYDGVREEAPRA